MTAAVTNVKTERHKAHYPIADIKTSSELQIRSVLDLKDKKQQLQHITSLASNLTGKRQLNPIELGIFDNQLWVLDGHHRLEAYKTANRTTIPAYITHFKTWAGLKAWVLLNANEDANQSLNMSQADRLNQAWQYYCIATEYGSKQLPLKVSEMQEHFGIGKNTPASFKHALKEASLHGVLDEWIETGVAPKWHEL